MRVKVHYKKELTSYFSTDFLADSEKEAEQRIRKSVENESWYSVELEIPSRSCLTEPKKIKII